VIIPRYRHWLRRLANTFIADFGALMLVFGFALFLLGAGVQLSRHVRLARDEQANIEPDFAASIAGAQPDVQPLASEAPVRVDGGAAGNRADRAARRSRRSRRDAARLDDVGDLTRERPASRHWGGSPSPPAAALAPPVPDAPKPDRILIPAIAVDSAVVEVGWEARAVNGERQGNVWQTADFAAGFHRGSSHPGQTGNTVISGHNNIKGAVFKDLSSLKPGDTIFVYAGERRWDYTVEHRFIVWEDGATDARRRANARWIDETPDERLTLVSCYPTWGNTHRVLVVARPTLVGAVEVQANAGPILP